MYKKLYRCTGLKAPWKLKKKRDLSSNRMSTRVITKKKKKKKAPQENKKGKLFLPYILVKFKQFLNHPQVFRWFTLTPEITSTDFIHNYLIYYQTLKSMLSQKLTFLIAGFPTHLFCGECWHSLWKL